MIVLQALILIAGLLVAYATGALHERKRSERERLDALLADPDACRFGQEETGGYFIGRRHCHTHNENEDRGRPRCHVGEEHDKEPQKWATYATKLPLLAPGQGVHFEQGEFVVQMVTSEFEDGTELHLTVDGFVDEVPVGSKVRTHVQMVDRESIDRDTKIVRWPPATDANVPGA